jgi:predicted tellurium resistance membrane protein TerC
MEWLADPHIWIAFLTLTALELVLGIDNIVFISILCDRLPPKTRDRARRIGLVLAMMTRIALLFLLSWIIGLTRPMFTIPWADIGISGRDLILIGGGLFLLWKSANEIHHLLEGDERQVDESREATFGGVLLQVALIDMVFSLDSIITAVGIVNEISVMVAAVVASVGLMMVFAKQIGDFVSNHPSIKMLALSFLAVIGVVLIADGFDHHVPKGYVYFAMAFSVGVELLNLRARKNRRSTARPVQLHRRYQRKD